MLEYMSTCIRGPDIITYCNTPGLYCIDNHAPYLLNDVEVQCNATIIDLCPERYYCPDARTMIDCPRGHFCREGTLKFKLFGKPSLDTHHISQTSMTHNAYKHLFPSQTSNNKQHFLIFLLNSSLNNLFAFFLVCIRCHKAKTLRFLQRRLSRWENGESYDIHDSDDLAYNVRSFHFVLRVPNLPSGEISGELW